MSPAAHALDRRLHDLRSGQQAIVADLVELEADGTYALLTARDRISGTTAARARPALAQVAELRPGLEPLGRLVDEVTEARRQGPLDDHRVIELVALLNRASVVVTSSVPDPPGPPGAGGPRPTGGPTRALTGQALLAAMEAAITTLRDLVAEVDDAWQAFLPRIERVTAEADALAAELPRHRAVNAARSSLSALSSLVVVDPLGATEGLAEVEAALAAAGDLRDGAARLHDVLAAAADTLATVESVVEAGHEGLQRSRAEVVAPQGLLAPVDRDVLTGERGLRPWLDRLERLASEGRADLAETGLERWQALADQTLAAARQVAEANAGPTRRRHELHGLLRAARVKAGAAGRAEDPKTTELGERADRALAAPCDLAEAEAEVGAYLAELRNPAPAPPAWKEMSA